MNSYLILFLSSFLSTSIFAQNIMEIDSIVIKGTKEKKKYTETISSITVLKDENIKSASQDTSISALNGVSNIQVNKNGESFSIRGINNTGVTGHQKDNLASIMVDDVFQTDLALKAGSFDLWDLDRIEVHRGAQSTLQGVNSLAGTILVNHNTATLYNEGKAKIGYGTFNRKEIGVVTNNVIISEKLAIRFSYNKEVQDGTIKNIATNNDKWGKKNKDNFSMGSIYLLNETDKILVDLKVLRNKTGGSYVQGPDPLKRQSNEDIDFLTRTNNQQASVRHLKSFSENISNTFVAAFSQSKNDEKSDADGAPINLAGIRIEDHEDQFMSLENLLNYKSDKISNTLGINFHRYRLLDHYSFNLLYPLSATVTTPVAVIQDAKKIRSVYSLFNSFNFILNEQHSFNVGARFEIQKNNFGTYVKATRTQNLGAATNTAVDTYLNNSSGTYGDNESSGIFLPKLAYVFHLENNHFGMSYTEGYRSGGLSINRSKAKAVNYRPETTDNFEISHKYEGKSFRVSSNAFYTNWKDQQVQVSLSNDFYDTQVENASRSELYGAEVQGQLSLNQANSFILNTGYVKTRFVSFLKNRTNYTGKEFPNAPRVTSMLTYKTQLTDVFSVSTIGRYLGRSYNDAENTRRAADQIYFDLNTQYTFASWALEVFVRNIFDKDYVINDSSPSSLVGYQVNYYQLNTPRELGVRLSYFW